MKKKYIDHLMTPVKDYTFRGVPVLLEASRTQLHWVWVIDGVWYNNNIELASDERLKTRGDWFGRKHPNGMKIKLSEISRMFEGQSLPMFPDSPWEITKLCINRVLDEKNR